MGYALGIDLGTTFTAAALVRGGRAEVVALGNHASTIPSMVFLRDDDTVLIGDAAERRGLQEPGRLAREFKRRLGDSAPIMLDRSPFSAERLMAAMLRQIVADVTARQGEAPDRIAVSHPANWGQFKIDLLRQSVELAGLQSATFVTEPIAAAVQYASTERVDVGDVVAVYDLGGGTFDAAVLRKTADGFETLGRPQGIERLGGIDFDEAVVTHVRRTMGDAIAQLDSNDPASRSALARLRQECVAAKETLSSDSDATIAVLLPNVQTQVRITRSELEDMIRPLLRETLDSTRRAVESAGLQLTDVKAVLLAGGSSRIPLVSEMVRNELGRPVVTDSHPKHSVALGAARVAHGQIGTGGAKPPPPPLAAPLPVAPVPVNPVAAGATVPPVAAAATVAMPATQTSTVRVPAASSASGAPEGKRSQWKLLVAGIVAAVLLVGGLVVAFGGGDDTPSTDPTTTAGQTVAAPVTTTGTTTDATTDVTTVTTADGTTATATPTTAVPQETCDDATGWCVGITSVEWGIDGVLRATYTTTGFVPTNSGVEGDFHVHFFWSSVPPEAAGLPGAGPWFVWDLADGGGEYLFDDISLDNLDQSGYVWEDDLCIAIATHQHTLATDAEATAVGTVYCLPDTPTPSAG
ncbi:MAG: Hsp70 family protein [Actinomycetota bacterium]|nr:Hsp70 family protein [Actinomycetota bacterium]